jgi:hypothetical protein
MKRSSSRRKTAAVVSTLSATAARTIAVTTLAECGESRSGSRQSAEIKSSRVSTRRSPAAGRRASSGCVIADTILESTRAKIAASTRQG